MFKRKLILFLLCAVPSYLAARIYPEGQEPVQEEVKQASNTPLEYAYVYIESNRTVRLMAENVNEKGEGDISFSSNGPMTAGITHILGSSEIVLTKAGTYQVTFMGTVTLNTPADVSLGANLSFGGTEQKVALFLNGQPVEGSGSFIPKQRVVSINTPQSRSHRSSTSNVALNQNYPINTQAIITVNAGDILTIKWYGRSLIAQEYLDIHPNTSMTIRQLARQ